MSILKLSGVNKSFGNLSVLKDVDIDVQKGEFIVFVGPSGCGKSTLLRLIAGLEDITSGDISIAGKGVNQTPPAKRGIAMVFQSYALYPHLTVKGNMSLALKQDKQPKNEIERRVAQASEMLDLTQYLERYPSELSGGQRQRVAIGRAIVREPKLFLFDEPLSNLDAALRMNTRVEIAKLHKQLGTTMIYVTHDQVEAMTLADRIVVLKDGGVEQFGTPMELYHHPQTKFVARFIGQPNMNFLSVKVSSATCEQVMVQLPNGTELNLPLNGSTVQTGDHIDIGIRPEDVELTDKGPLGMTVNILERLGGLSIAYGETDGIPFCAALNGRVVIKEEQAITLGFDPNNVHGFDSQGKALPRLNAPSVNG